MSFPHFETRMELLGKKFTHSVKFDSEETMKEGASFQGYGAGYISTRER
jgi:hypothetical protein